MNSHCEILAKTYGFEALIGESIIFQDLRKKAKKISQLDVPILITGETGVGKELFARVCHHGSHRTNYPFLVLNCSSIPDNVLENELFGGLVNGELQQGIFELADKGTVFLDKIGEMTPTLQLKLLRFLQDGTFRRVGENKEIKVDVRVISSTKSKLHALVEAKMFRQDLYYRLNVLNINIPPLREHSSDIGLLAKYFIYYICSKFKFKTKSIDKRAIEILEAYTWPGNIRELRNIIYQTLIENPTEIIGKESIRLPEIKLKKIISKEPQIPLILNGSLSDIMQYYEEIVLRELYADFSTTRKLATRLGISHTAVANKLREYNIGK